MTYVYLDPEGLQTYINDLESHATDMDDERATVSRVNTSESDPAGIAGSVNLGSTIDQRCADLREKKNELQVRLDEAVAMNESGITPMDAEGRVAYYLPDAGPGSQDTVENVQAYNSESVANAEADAAAMAQARSSRDGVAEDGRTVDDILEEMAKHQDVPAYGATFVNTYGIEEFIELPIGMRWNYTSTAGSGGTASGQPKLTTDWDAVDRANGILGHILAAATRTESYPEGYSSWSDAMYATVTEEGHRGRMSSLNALLAAPGAVYDTETLVELGDQFEDLPFDGDPASSTPDSVNGWHDDDYGWMYNEGPALTGSSMDPMYGVMMAMGNNPDAAHEYLTAGNGHPDGDAGWEVSPEMEERWRLLTERSWDSEVGLDAFTAAQAAVSSKRGDSDSDVSDSATWVTARAIEHMVNEVPSDQYTDAMKENLSVVVANCSSEAVAVAQGGSPKGLGLSGKEPEQSTAITSLIYRIIDNENAAATVSAGMAQSAADSTDVTTIGNLELKYANLGAVYGYLEAIGTERQEDLSEASASEEEAAKNSANTALSVVMMVAGTAISGPAASLAWGVGTTITKPLIADQLVPESSDPSVQIPVGRRALESQGYIEAVNSGLLPGGDAVYNEEFITDQHGNRYEWCVTDDEGNPYFDLSVGSKDDQSDEVHDWAILVEKSVPDDLDGGAFGRVNSGVETGVGRGEARIEGGSISVDRVEIKK